MPKIWQVDLSDGRTVDVESDTEPNEDELLSSLSSWQEPKAQPESDAPSLEPPSGVPVTPESIAQSERNFPQSQPMSPWGDIRGQPDTGFTEAIYSQLPRDISHGFEKVMKPIEKVASDTLNLLAEMGVNAAAGPGNDFVPQPLERPLAEPGRSIIPGLEPSPEAMGIIPSLRRAGAGMTTPGMLATLPIAAESKLVQGAFMAGAGASVPQAVQAVTEAKTPAETRGALTDLALSLGMTGLIGHGMAREKLPAKAQPGTQLQPSVPREGIAAEVAKPVEEVKSATVAEAPPPEAVAGPEFIKSESSVDRNAAQDKLAAETDLPALKKMAAEATAEVEQIQKDFSKTPPTEQTMQVYQEAAAKVQFLNEAIQKKTSGKTAAAESKAETGEQKDLKYHASKNPDAILQSGEIASAASSGQGPNFSQGYVWTDPKKGGVVFSYKGEVGSGKVHEDYWGRPITASNRPIKLSDPNTGIWYREAGTGRLIDVKAEFEAGKKTAQELIEAGKAKSSVNASQGAPPPPAQPASASLVEGTPAAGAAVESAAAAEPKPEFPETAESIQAGIKVLENQIGELKAQRPKPTTKQEAWLEGDPFLEGQTKWNDDLETKISRMETDLRFDQETLSHINKPSASESQRTKDKVESPDWTSATEEAVAPEAIKNGLKIKLGNQKEGGFVNAEILKDLVNYGKTIYEKGMTAAKWVARVVSEFGEKARQYAVEAWGKVVEAYRNSEFSDETGAISLGGRGAMPKFADRKMSPLDKVTTSHSGKLQKSFSEARLAQNEIKKAVPSDRRQGAISIYREAGGDMAVLKDWETRAKQKWMRDASRDAQTLTPKEAGLLPKIEAAYSTMETRGNTHDVLKSHRENYVTHVWDVKRPGTGFGTGMLKERFRFSKARTFNTFFEGDQAGFKPKTLAIGKLLPAYLHEMNKVIADRQMVRDLAKGTMPDGSPMVSPRGNSKVVDGPGGKAVLVSPKAMREADVSDYKTMSDQPALSDWTWEGKDTDGKPVFVKADLALHPDVYRRVNATIGQSALRNWYHDPVSGPAQIPRAIVRGLDTAQSAMKREMFGLLAPFHQVQEGWHGIAHRVNPLFGLEKIDLVKNPRMVDAANHGLMLLPDRASSRVYLEGVGTQSSLLSQGLRKSGKATAGVGEAIADVIDGYQDYLFHQYIPALKFKTYEAMVERNTELYAKELASGEMTKADIKLTSAEQSNAAYGHLNYALLDRNPTIQHLIQLSLLAPDFLEARARFAGQAVKGARSKVGTEQLKAIAFIAAVQAGSAFLISQLLGVPYDKDHPFEVVYNGRRFALRSVPEDIFGLAKDTRQFVYSRVNPLTVKGGVQLATGLNYRGEKVSATDTLGELLAGYIPITARAIPAVRSLTETGRKSPVTPLQQLAGSLGLRISRYSPISETYNLAGEWMDKQKMAKDRGSYPVSKYQQLRYALEDGDLERAKAEYEALKKDTPSKKIRDGFKQSINHPFTGSEADDKRFSKTLTGYDKELYEQALRSRKNILKAFKSL